MKKITKRILYFFVCSKCKKDRRTTLKPERAIDQLCGNCRREKVPEGQTTLFDGDSKI